jgi:hypothetical protein
MGKIKFAQQHLVFISHTYENVEDITKKILNYNTAMGVTEFKPNLFKKQARIALYNTLA